MTEIDICNNALLYVNKSSISSLTLNESIQAKDCLTIYEHSRRKLLAKHIWSFATDYGSATYLKNLNYRNSEQPPWNDVHPKPNPNTYKNDTGYGYLYEIPRKMLSLVEVQTSDGEHLIDEYEIRYFSLAPVLYELAARTYLFTNYGNEATATEEVRGPRLKYTVDVENTLLFPPLFCEALIFEIALALAQAYVGSSQYLVLLEQKLQKVINAATSTDCAQLLLRYGYRADV
jgi:hypothetical protein